MNLKLQTAYHHQPEAQACSGQYFTSFGLLIDPPCNASAIQPPHQYITLSGEPHNALHSPCLVIHIGNFHPLENNN